MSQLLSVNNLRVSYPGSTAWSVDDVSFNLSPGERMGLVGESGCGKSTLGRAILRLLPNQTRTEGQILFDRRSVLGLTPEGLRQFRGEAVSLIFQDPMTRLDPLMTIGDHCVETLLAHQPKLTRQQAKSRTFESLDAVSIATNRFNQYPHEFSGGMRQRVAIALALLLNPRMIVADEPTTALDVTVSAQILKELTRLCQERQMALLLISHDLAMVSEYCDRLAVMYQGKFVETGPAHDVFSHPQHDYTRALVGAALTLQHVDELRVDEPRAAAVRALGAALPTPESQSGTFESQSETSQPAPLLKLENLQRHYVIEQPLLARWMGSASQTVRAVDGITLELHAGETLGLVGESGCGKSTLSRTILQLVKPTGGRVEFLGQDLAQLSRGAMQHQRRQMQMIFQDPSACLNPRMTVGESIADPLLIHHMAKTTEARQQMLQLLERVGLTPAEEYAARYPKQLSGGQQQRVAIARALITRPQLVICDEPVSMLDATVQAQVLELMRELKTEFNLTYLFITHDLWVARFFCDRIAVMQAGQIVELEATEQLFRHPQHPYTQTLLGAAPMLASF